MHLAGVDCGHERAFSMTRHGEGDWIAESSWCAVPYLSNVGSETYVVHLVRNPLCVISSRAAWGTFPDDGPGRDDRGAFAIKHCPEIALGRNPIERAAIHWVEWNKRCAIRDELVRIEDVEHRAIERYAYMVGTMARFTHPSALPPRVMNTAGWPPERKLLEWSDVEHVPGVLELARRYGYY